MKNRQSSTVLRQNSWHFVLFTLLAAASAALAAWSSAALALEVWVMFAGLIAWFSRPASWRQGVFSMLCLWLGIGLGALSHVAMSLLSPKLGPLALPLVVFCVAIITVGLRETPVVNNTLAWFLGMVTFYAAQMTLSSETFAHLCCATAIGGLAGWVCQALHHYGAGLGRLPENRRRKTGPAESESPREADLG